MGKQAKMRKPYTHTPEWQSRRGVQVSLRIDRNLLEWIDERRTADSVTRNEVVRRLIKKGINHYDDTI